MVETRAQKARRRAAQQRTSTRTNPPRSKHKHPNNLPRSKHKHPNSPPRSKHKHPDDAPCTMWFVAVAVVGLLSYSPFSGHSAANPKFPFSTHSAASDVMQAVCNAHGHLQRLAEHPSDHVTAFSLLGLDPKERPFYPHDKSHRKWDEWHQELLGLVDKRYMGFLEREGEDNGHDGGEGEQYKLALTAASHLLSKDKPRRFYVETVLPTLENVLRG
ncbi:hypothetical protein C8A01DRAFT_31747 [Parachaetomium inaequale]|uniref:Uncharacterized protein n=1 Tax=Parachaetomium inaequale TaxID=2588326 RepID=A0AAN6PQ40_9PEZI|nr:hypothetical protein C8A01DRAFT_31747 [Parachaetomium inaequale]